MNFKELHYCDEPLVICNVWDVTSAKIAEKAGFKAIGTSSAAIANLLGYQDGESISFDELDYLIKRIALNTKIPLSVDLESGYHRNPDKVTEYIKRLADVGVVGINIEDSVVGDKRQLLDAEHFAKIILAIKNQLVKDNIEVFLNVRTDAFILNMSDALEETKKRSLIFENSGADGLFVPCIEKENDIAIIVEHTKLPVNVMCMPQLPSFNRLQELGVKRISMGDFIFNNIYHNYESILKTLTANQSFDSIF
ncbi:isocitrate lyase/PEP mutase family protein [Aliikangiella maris]|uniref:Isocitrate lyase/phosphoenolpyruvate mutase family protein n=2 Tax=Aliikangiella maris TaxID=3162458 RepID=A0ABV3ML29_9GAMM